MRAVCKTAIGQFDSDYSLQIRKSGRVWLITPVLKIGEGNTSVGSNPTSSSKFIKRKAMKKLTIIIPYFNDREVLHKICLPSLLHIDRDVVDIIIVDDNSDIPLEISEEFLGLGCNITRLADNVGAGEARQAGLNIAQTEWVCFLDSDDALLTDFSLVYSELDSSVDVIKTKVQKHTKEGVESFLTDGVVHGSFYRVSFLRENNIYFLPKLRYHEDNYFNTVATLFAKEFDRFKFLDIYTYAYRDLNLGLSRKGEGFSYMERTYPEWCLATYSSIEKFYTRFPERRVDVLRMIVWHTFYIYFHLQADAHKESKNLLSNKLNAESLLRKLYKKAGVKKEQIIIFVKSNPELYFELKKLVMQEEQMYFIEETGLVNFIRDIDF